MEMSKKVKLSDIAEKVGVSVVTVSKALSGQKGVSDKVRDEIIRLADEMGYVQPSVARAREKTVSYSIGVVIQEGYLGETSFYWQMYQQISQRALERGSFSMLEVIDDAMEERLILPKLATGKKTDGIVVIGPLGDKYLGKLINETDIPMIFMDFADKKQREDCVISDSFYGAYYMTNYLMDMGHSRIAYVGTVGTTGSITDRYLGYMRSLIEHGITPRKEWLIDDRDTASGEIGENNKLKLPREMPTAFFCNCDLTAGILINKLKKEGYRVPEDISVAGFDDFIYSGLCDTEITTYAVDIHEMAARTINTLIKKISGEHYDKGTQVVTGRIVVKDSVRRIR